MEERDIARSKSQPEGQLGLFVPKSDWRPHSGPLPRVRDTIVGLDTETWDQGLNTDIGPGWAYGLGHMLGVAAAWSGTRVYASLRHPETENRSVDEVLDWVEYLMRHNTVVFHNAPYDMGWLCYEGLSLWPERMEDTYAASVMLDENLNAYDLDSMCKMHGLPGKDETLLRDAAAAYGIHYSEIKNHLKRLPARFVGPYAEQDAESCLGLWSKLRPQLEADNVGGAYRTETRLMPVVYKMRKRGIRVSVDTAEQTRAALRVKRDEVLSEIGRMSSRRVNMTDIVSSNALAVLFDQHGLEYPRTPPSKNFPNGNPSFEKGWLESNPHPLAGLIRRGRQLNDLAEKFIGTYVLEHLHRGRIHAEIHQLRDGEAGARTFRFSYSNPPLQQTPARGSEEAVLIRNAFLAEQGCRWGAADYSQQEPRLAVHYASLCGIHGAEEAVRYYSDNENADFHQMVADMSGLHRSAAKILNLALMYGMGLVLMAIRLGLSVEEAEEMLETYHNKVPWVRGLAEFCDRMAAERGYIRLIDGARCHFPLWEPAAWGWQKKESDPRNRVPQTYERALQLWPSARLKRAKTHTAFNREVQGSAARQTKIAMLAADQAGIPLMLQMHDELGASIETESQGNRLVECMKEAVTLVVPVKVDMEYGRHWGEAKYTWSKCPV